MNEFISEKTLDLNDLISQINEDTTLAKTNIDLILNSLFQIVSRTLNKGEVVPFADLGKFFTIRLPKMYASDPISGAKIEISERKQFYFKGDEKLINFLNGFNVKSGETKVMLHTKITSNIKTLFQHIATDTLTDDVLKNLISNGCDVDMINRNGNTPLIYAYRKHKNNIIKLLLDNDANPNIAKHILDEYSGAFIEDYENYTTIADLARDDNNIAVLLMLAKNKARQNALQLQQLKTNPEQYTEESKRRIEAEADALDNNKESDIHTTIKTIITQDSILQKYPQLLALVEAITHLDYTFDITGGNADDKIEAATIEFKIKKSENNEEKITHRLEYFLLSNWSYADVRRMLLWRTNEKTRNILNIKNTELTTLSDHEKALRVLANGLLGKKNNMPLEHFARFLIVLLSRIVQKNKRTIEAHIEELGLQQTSSLMQTIIETNNDIHELKANNINGVN